MSNNFIFKNNNDKLEYVGDFNGLYSNESDPWNQSGSIRKEYAYSRKRQINILKNTGITTLLDIGCGLGYTTDIFNNFFISSGLDVSSVAISRAREKYSNLNFYCEDITDTNFNHNIKYDCVVFNQLLWYIIADFKSALINVKSILNNRNSKVLISNFIFESDNQNYGKEYFDGIGEIVSWLLKYSDLFKVEEYYCHKLDDKYYDFHMLFTDI